MEAKARERLYRLVDQIPEGEVHAAARYLEYLAEHGDPFIRKLMNAPIDDEPVTPEEDSVQGKRVPIRPLRIHMAKPHTVLQRAIAYRSLRT